MPHVLVQQTSANRFRAFPSLRRVLPCLYIPLEPYACGCFKFFHIEEFRAKCFCNVFQLTMLVGIHKVYIHVNGCFCRKTEGSCSFGCGQWEAGCISSQKAEGEINPMLASMRFEYRPHKQRRLPVHWNLKAQFKFRRLTCRQVDVTSCICDKKEVGRMAAGQGQSGFQQWHRFRRAARLDHPSIPDAGALPSGLCRAAGLCLVHAELALRNFRSCSPLDSHCWELPG